MVPPDGRAGTRRGSFRSRLYVRREEGNTLAIPGKGYGYIGSKPKVEFTIRGYTGEMVTYTFHISKKQLQAIDRVQKLHNELILIN
jgi:hypothetical protein